MSDQYFGKIRRRWSATGVGTNAGVTVSRSAEAGRAHVITGIQCSGDAAAVVTVKTSGGTIYYRKRFAAAFNMSETFAPGVIIFDVNTGSQVDISASTANCEANIQGFTIAAAA